MGLGATILTMGAPSLAATLQPASKALMLSPRMPLSGLARPVPPAGRVRIARPGACFYPARERMRSSAHPPRRRAVFAGVGDQFDAVKNPTRRPCRSRFARVNARGEVVEAPAQAADSHLGLPVRLLRRWQAPATVVAPATAAAVRMNAADSVLHAWIPSLSPSPNPPVLDPEP